MMLSSVDMPLKSAMFWKVRAMPWRATCVRPHRARRVSPRNRDLALLRVVEAVDDVQHRRLAGAVRADDRPDLALADVEGDVLDRGHAAEAQRDVAELHQHVADPALGGRRGEGGRAAHPRPPGRSRRKAALRSARPVERPPRRCCRRDRAGRRRSTPDDTTARRGPPLSRPPAASPAAWKRSTAERSSAWKARCDVADRPLRLAVRGVDVELVDRETVGLVDHEGNADRLHAAASKRRLASRSATRRPTWSISRPVFHAITPPSSVPAPPPPRRGSRASPGSGPCGRPRR